jgi:hypothetical protein
MRADIRLRIPDSQKNEEWYEEIINDIIPYDQTVSYQYERMKRCYDILNNDLTRFKEHMEEFCSQVPIHMQLPDEEPENLLPYNRIYSKYMYQVGEMHKRGDNIEAMILSDRENKKKDEELYNLLTKSVDESIQLGLEKEQLKQQGLPDDEINKALEEKRNYPPPEQIVGTHYKSEAEQFYNDVIQYFKWKFDWRKLKDVAFKHLMATDGTFTGILEMNGQPKPIVTNNLHVGFHKSPDTFDIKNADYFWIKVPITLADVYNEIGNEVSPEEIEQLVTFTGSSNNRANKHHEPGPDARAERSELLASATMHYADDREVGHGMGSMTNRRFNSETLTWKTYLQFKAYRQVWFITRTNEYGEEVTEIAPPNFKPPKDAAKTKITNDYGQKSTQYEFIDDYGDPCFAEKLWVPRRYEVTRYGSKLIWNFRECPYQPLFTGDPFGDFTLGINGRFISNLNSQPISLVERAMNTQFQYYAVKALQTKEITKYEGFIKNISVDMIPEYLHTDENGEPLYEGIDKIAMFMYLRRSLGYALQSRTEGLMPNYNTGAVVRPEMAGAFGEIIQMQQFLELLDREIGMQMLVPPQAEGVIAPNSNASDNQMAIQQGYTMSESYFIEFNKIMADLVNEYLRQFRMYYVDFFRKHPNRKEHFLNYISSDGLQKVLKITPDVLDYEDIGVYVGDETNNEEYRKFMLQSAHAFAQNAGQGMETLSNLFLSIVKKDSPEKIHKKLSMAAAEQEQRMQQMQQQQQQAMMQAEQKKEQVEINKIMVKGEIDKEIKAMDLQKYMIDASSNESEGDRDEIPQSIEMAKEVQKMDLAQREQTRKERETNIKSAQLNRPPERKS